MRKKRAIMNIICSLVLEFVTILSGLIIPRIIIGFYGSGVNGLINSITSFVGYIMILQLGVGSVVKASLYKPLGQNDTKTVMNVIKATNVFFTRLGYVSIFYLLILAFLYPPFLAKEFDFLFTFSLVIIIGLSTAFNYLFGITYQILLEADQKAYVFSLIQIITVIVNVVVVLILARFEVSINTLKGVSSVIYIIRPLLIKCYVTRKYKIDLSVKYDSTVISKRWDGFAQGLAYYIHTKTDLFVLTIFTSFETISIYSIYALITSGLTSVFTSIDSSLRATLGNIASKEGKDYLRKVFCGYNSLLNIICCAVFSTATITVFPFITVYIGNVKDAEYYQPLFGVLILMAEFIYCLRLPFNSVVMVYGMFKETKKSSFIEAFLNIAVSIILVNQIGLVGVAIGTLVAMTYRTVYLICFLNRNIIYLGYANQIKKYSITFITYAVNVCLLSKINLNITSFIYWGGYAMIIFICTLCLVVLTNVLFDKKSFDDIMLLVKTKRGKDL